MSRTVSFRALGVLSIINASEIQRRVIVLVVIIALCIALVIFVGWALWKMADGGRPTDARERCRRDIAALRNATRARRDVRARERDVWSAGADSEGTASRTKRTVSWLAIGTVGGGCGGGCAAGCGGGGCGGCGGCGG